MTSTDHLEQWRPVPGWDGYEVSDHGRVRSLPRTVYVRNRWNTVLSPRQYPGILLQPTVGTHGYLRVRLSRPSARGDRDVHRLVLEAFVGPCPDGLEACHGPAGKTVNRVNNLRWDTRSENGFDRVRHGTHYLVNRPACKRGHELAGDNLLRAPQQFGRRGCLACARTTAAWHQLPRDVRAAVTDREGWLQQESDRRYVVIRAGFAPSHSRRRVDDQHCVALYREGHSGLAIGRMLGIPSQAVYNALHRRGEPRRNRGRAPSTTTSRASTSSRPRASTSSPTTVQEEVEANVDR